MTDTTEIKEVVTNEKIIEKLVPIYEEIGTLTEDAKIIIKEAKDAGLDGVSLAKVAKAKADDKLGDLADKTQSLIDLIDSLT